MLNVEVIGNNKRKRCGRVFRFKNFAEPGYPVVFGGPFRENVNALLQHANLESDLSMPMWSFELEVHHHPPLHILLFVIEEAVEAVLNRHCKHCQYVGNVHVWLGKLYMTYFFFYENLKKLYIIQIRNYQETNI